MSLINFKDLAQGLEVVRRCRADQAEGDVKSALDRKILELVNQMSAIIADDDRISRRARAEQALEDAAPSTRARLEAKAIGTWPGMVQRVLHGQKPADVWAGPAPTATPVAARMAAYIAPGLPGETARQPTSAAQPAAPAHPDTEFDADLTADLDIGATPQRDPSHDGDPAPADHPGQARSYMNGTPSPHAKSHAAPPPRAGSSRPRPQTGRDGAPNGPNTAPGGSNTGRARSETGH
ncbi:MAG: hypothetical protein GC159_18160 [Phycisphaera sp.]|nr:hypothetical protein [Phycisphaera sp.]